MERVFLYSFFGEGEVYDVVNLGVLRVNLDEQRRFGVGLRLHHKDGYRYILVWYTPLAYFIGTTAIGDLLG